MQAVEIQGSPCGGLVVRGQEQVRGGREAAQEWLPLSGVWSTWEDRAHLTTATTVAGHPGMRLDGLAAAASSRDPMSHTRPCG